MTRLLAILALCFATLTPLLPSAFGQRAGRRQYYSNWAKHPNKPYYYKKSASARDYGYHYGIYYPSRGKRVYMYNPHKKTYWGYWEGDNYSLLPPRDRKASIDDIDAESFPKPGKPPAIPESDDKEEMMPPPADFPRLNDDTP